MFVIVAAVVLVGGVLAVVRALIGGVGAVVLVATHDQSVMAFQARALTPAVSLEFDGLSLVATIHPSAVLRTPDDRRDEVFAGLVADLEFAGRTAAHELT